MYRRPVLPVGLPRRDVEAATRHKVDGVATSVAPHDQTASVAGSLDVSRTEQQRRSRLVIGIIAVNLVLTVACVVLLLR